MDFTALDLPILYDDEKEWLESLTKRGKYRNEIWLEDKPKGVWRWYYDENKTRLEAELIFWEDGNPRYFTCWYENGAEKAAGPYKDGFPRYELWTFWSEDGKEQGKKEEETKWNPVTVAYIAYAVAYTATTIYNCM